MSTCGANISANRDRFETFLFDAPQIPSVSGGEYGGVTSTSNCTDYQARRLNARYKVKGEKGTRFLHTLNGTAIAISRALVAIVELYQQKDGSIVVPEVLRAFVGKETIGTVLR